MEESNQLNPTPPSNQNPKPNIGIKPNKPKKPKTVPILIVLAVLLAATAGYFAWQYTQANKDKKAAQDQVASLTKELSDTKSQLAESQSQEKTNEQIKISSELKENIAAAVTSGNLAALEGSMDSSVTVVIAASEKGGAVSPAQAVKDLAYLDSGTDPWDFNLSAATLQSYADGPYGRYFGTGTYAGKSANGYVVSFGINSDSKITTVFMAANSDLLT